MIEHFLTALGCLFSQRGVNVMFVILCWWAALGGCPRRAMIASALLYGALALAG